MATIRTVHVGLGTVGQLCLRRVASRPGLEVVGAIDPQPALVGQDAGLVAGVERPLGVPITPDWSTVPRADVAVVCTTSRLAEVRPVVVAAFEQGLDVVSTCEALAAPPPDDADALALDALGRERGRRVLGIGVNPGFVMDALPLVLTAAQGEVWALRVRRVVDLATRRPQLAAKMGAGLELAAFRAAAAQGVLGHVGLAESARLLAAGLGWSLDTVRETLRPVLGPDGRCLGGRQRLRAWERGQLRLTLDLVMAYGARPSGDTIWLEGRPPLRWTTRPATPGEEATAALVANVLPVLRTLPPGLRTVLDLVPLRCRSGG
ncbi:MAG TPA: dihydrodipicolinate reductase [Chloroflexota bacterium]|nr:dihydrodipicolinate reductase [Chloroflexota bacterium]